MKYAGLAAGNLLPWLYQGRTTGPSATNGLIILYLVTSLKGQLDDIRFWHKLYGNRNRSYVQLGENRNSLMV